MLTLLRKTEDALSGKAAKVCALPDQYVDVLIPSMMEQEVMSWEVMMFG